jgi:hypothetical protein
MKLQLKTPPLQEPLTLEEVKIFLRLSTDQENEILKTLITSSRAYVEGVTGRALLKQGWLMHLKMPYPASFPLTRMKTGEIEITLPFPPLLSVDFVKVGGNNVSYQLTDNKILLEPYHWKKDISVSFWAGYGEDPSTLPPDLKMAVLMATRFFYEGQKADIPLLKPYRVMRVG